MHLAQQTRDFTTWTRQVMGVFLGVRRWTTLGVIAAEAISDLTKLLAFFLPLKIILLAGSDGVPRYFPFIDPAYKVPWIVGLAVGAFIAYGLTLLLDSLAERLAEGASSDVLQGANEMALSSNQHEQALNAYAKFCRVHANVLVVIVGGLAMAAFKPMVAAFLFAALAIQYAITAAILAGDDDIRPGPIKAWVSGRLNAYLEINSSITFLLGFVVLLLPYLYGAGGNILLAILSIIILRQILVAVTGTAKNAVQLTRQRDRISAQVFHDKPQERAENRNQRTLRELFRKASRQQQTREILVDALGHGQEADVCWADSPRPFVSTLVIGPLTEGRCERYLQQQIYNPGARVHLENESFLFRHIDRARLYAPERVARFMQEPFECQIVDYGQGRPLTGKQWKQVQVTIAADVLGCQPPQALVTAFRKSRPLLGERIDERLLGRVEVGADTAAEAAAVAGLHEALPALRERLAMLPLCIDNRDIVQPTSAIDHDDQPMLMFWGRWTLEPLGGTWLHHMCECDLKDLLPQIATRRSDLRDGVYVEDLELADMCRRLENHDLKARYKEALGTLTRIVENLATERTARAA